MATWPTTLPNPMSSGYEIMPADQTVRTDMEVGSARVRRRTRARIDEVSLAWEMTDAQMVIFRDWFENTSTGAAGGASWFTISLPGAGGLTSTEARFSGTYKVVAMPGLNWIVTAKAEVRHA